MPNISKSIPEVEMCQRQLLQVGSGLVSFTNLRKGHHSSWLQAFLPKGPFSQGGIRPAVDFRGVGPFSVETKCLPGNPFHVFWCVHMAWATKKWPYDHLRLFVNNLLNKYGLRPNTATGQQEMTIRGKTILRVPAMRLSRLKSRKFPRKARVKRCWPHRHMRQRSAMRLPIPAKRAQKPSFKT